MGDLDLAAEFATFKRSAWRLCALDTYDAGDDERASLDAWTRDRQLIEPDNGWLPIVRAARGRGASVGRVQVFSRPLTLYGEWLLAVYPLNVAAGEDVRVAYRDEHPAGLPDLTVDFWMFDDERVARLVYDHRGRFITACDDTAYLDDYRRLRDRALAVAQPIGRTAVA